MQNRDLKTLIVCDKLAPLLCWGLPKGFYSLEICERQSRNRDLLWELQPLATSSIIIADQSRSTGSYNKHDVTISLASKAGVLHGCKTLSDENYSHIKVIETSSENVLVLFARLTPIKKICPDVSDLVHTDSLTSILKKQSTPLLILLLKPEAL